MLNQREHRTGHRLGRRVDALRGDRYFAEESHRNEEQPDVTPQANTLPVGPGSGAEDTVGRCSLDWEARPAT